MRFVADLHIHSHYSRATSKDLTLPELARWAQRKGVHIVGTGDITHPGWLGELKAQLEPAEPGLYRLKPDLAQAVAAQVPPACRGEVRFLLAGEISTIYKKAGKTRKIHHLVFAPDLLTVERLQARLERIGNIRSDGRPILGLPSRDLLELLLDLSPRCHLIPAHIWTPWFALLGSMSGYDSVEACFEDLTPYIFALETGLSSDPPMNWRVSALDRYTLISSSDAHSPAKLGREATLFTGELSYDALFAAIRSADPACFGGTIEFFPEEGKYHYDGHRRCGIRWQPATTLAHNGLCSVCGKPVTVGVYHRVETLADRGEGEAKPQAPPFYRLIPLPEVLAELHGVGSGKVVAQAYEHLLATLGPELTILLDLPLETIATVGGERLAAGIGRMRRGEVSTLPGYDGEYGVIRVFAETQAATWQPDLFGAMAPAAAPTAPAMRPPLAEPPPVFAAAPPPPTTPPIVAAPAPSASAPDLLAGLNEVQRQAVLCTDRPLLIVAGPGTGKTHTLTTRIAYLVQALGVAPESILAITFTNKAAAEMAARLTALLGAETVARLTIKTFHAFGAMVLRQWAEAAGLDPDFVILTEAERREWLRRSQPELNEEQVTLLLEQIGLAKNRLFAPEAESAPEQEPWANDPVFRAAYRRYQAELRRHQAVDFDDLVFLVVGLLETHPHVLAALHSRYRWIAVDEYQDINLAQYRLLRLLTANGANLCVIGDPNQAIYGFRGADYRYFLRFGEDYPDAQRLVLAQNYRSLQPILDAATQVIAREAPHQPPRLWSPWTDNVKITVQAAATDKGEAEFVIRQIEALLGGSSYFALDTGRATGHEMTIQGFADFAVLYRLHGQSQVLVDAFERAGYPYQVIGKTPLTAYRVVQEALTALRHLARAPTDPVQGELPPELASLRGRNEMTVAEWITRLMAAWERRLHAADRERLQQLYRRSLDFGADVRAFLEAMALYTEADEYDPRADRITLMTLHAAKGLEFSVVFIVGCEEGLLPYMRAGAATDIAEERRLFYVGMTRARRRLILSYARSRFLFGQYHQHPPSRFLDDIALVLKDLQREERHPRPASAPAFNQLSLFDG
jgi:DNA helicase-2/ATP-dependent DNA helicase PcrA